jgi:hypothetical protein
MTDLERFVKLYADLGIDCKVTEEEDGRKTIIFQIPNFEVDSDFVTYSDKFCGYEVCYSEIIFDKTGKLISQGFYMEVDDETP